MCVRENVCANVYASVCMCKCVHLHESVYIQYSIVCVCVNVCEHSPVIW